MNKRQITILGSSGSIGVQTLEVVDQHPDIYTIVWLTVNNNLGTLLEQVKKYKPLGVVINDAATCERFKAEAGFSGYILEGKQGLIEAASDPRNDIVISALVGFSGVAPTLAALKAGTNIALANKETLVAAGRIITDAAKKSNAEIITVDSEHSAILQCLSGENHDEVEKLILTASGGPFRDMPYEKFTGITLADALNHPNWSMGSKITIDSATMMNKGLEVIEAHWLFDMPQDKIDVLIHPQSIIHSMIQFRDSSVKAQLGVPDMKLPIAYALNYPRRPHYNFDRLDFTATSELTFRQPDLKRFPCLGLAYDALATGKTAPAILNAANEVAVDAFLKEEITFLNIPATIEKVLNKAEIFEPDSLEAVTEADKIGRSMATEILNGKR